VARIRKKALVTLVPSRYETFGLTAAEAMLAGCPLVVSGAGALTELIEAGQNGLVARPGDADDLAEKVLTLLRDPQQAAALGRQAAIDAAAKYAPAIVADATMQFYRTLLGR
jgi:glycosyltransferase involved in cell wall biosynthesis